MRYIKQISVQKLFGLFDHMIPLRLDEKITIIHGPNGMGKTIILNMIKSLSQSNFDIFYKIPFENFQIIFDDSSSIKVSRVILEKAVELGKELSSSEEQFELLCNYRITPNNINRFYLRRRQNPAGEMKDILRFINTVTEKLGGLSFRGNNNSNTGSFYKRTKEYTLYDFIEEYGNRLSIIEKQHLIFHMHQIPNDYVHLLEDMMVRFVSTQRLITPKGDAIASNTIGADDLQLPESNGVFTISVFSNELSNIMSAKNNEYAALSQKLDSDFPNRVIEQSITDDSVRSYEELRAELINLEDKRNRLREVGLLDQGKVESLQAINNTSRLDYVAGVLEIYLKDAWEKLSVFDNLAEQIRLLIQIINDRLMLKKFKVDRRRGFVVTLNDGKELNPTDLSSGEQHEVVLAYELLFNVRSNSLILIDEPEISLHIAWQEAFLKDLISIAKLRDFYVLIATHSPSIVDGRWDLTVDLVEQDHEEADDDGQAIFDDDTESNVVYEVSDEDDDLGDGDDD